MRKITCNFLFIVLFIAACPVSADGTWTYYMDSNTINDFEIHGDSIYCATNGGLVVWNLNDGTYEQEFYIAETACCQYQRTMLTVIGVGSDGIIWCSHGENNNIELLAFDGSRWTVYTPENSGLPGRPNSLAVDSGNVLWMSTAEEVVSFDGTTWKTYTEDEAGNTLRVLFGIDRNDVKWFSTSKGVSSYDGSIWKTYTRENGLPGSGASDMSVSPDNVVWFAFRDNRALAGFDGESWTTIEGLTFPPFTIAVSNDNIWCGTNEGLYEYDGTAWSRYHYGNSDLFWNNVRALETDENGFLWHTYGHEYLLINNMYVYIPEKFVGINRFDGETCLRLRPDGPLSYFLQSVTVDHNNVKWFGGFEKGLSQFDGNEWINYPMADTTRIENIIAIAADNDNVIWASYSTEYRAIINDKYKRFEVNGIVSYDGSLWTVYPESVTGIEGLVSSIAVDHNNVKWFTSRDVTASFNGEQWVQYDKDGFGNTIRPPVAVDRENVKWFQASGGVSSFDGTDWTYYQEKTFRDRIQKIVVDKNNIKWYLSGAGASSFDGNDWKHYGFPVNVKNLADTHDINVIHDLCVDNHGLVWFISSEFNYGFQGGGLSSFDGSVWTYHRDESWLVYAARRLAIDRDDVMWVVSHSGIAQYDPREGPTEVSGSSIHPEQLKIKANYPNPFNLSTTISFTLPYAGFTTLSVYNVAGQKVRELVSSYLPSGEHSVVWNGYDDSGIPVSSGIYFSGLDNGQQRAAGRMLMVK